MLIPWAQTEAEELLPGGAIAPERVEFAPDWDEKTTGPRLLRAICGFANDFSEVNGGYVVLGAARGEQRPLAPERGLSDAAVTAARKWVGGACRKLDPPYFPILCERTVEGRRLLVVHAPTSEVRPHRMPGGRGRPARCWVRRGADTVDAEREGYLRRHRDELAARVPWDDRPSYGNQVEDLSGVTIREYLRAVGSRLLHGADDIHIRHGLRLTTPGYADAVPRNVGLLLFSPDPAQWFPGARIEVTRFDEGHLGRVSEERTFRGGLFDQIRDCLSYLARQSATDLEPERKTIAAPRWGRYPGAAVRELLVNALIHRAYGTDETEPIRVRVYPDRLTVTSHPGPVPALEPHHFLRRGARPAIPARNPRVAGFLKDRGLTEGRYSGLDRVFRLMEENGSPPPGFTFDEGRTHFTATLPAHPDSFSTGVARETTHPPSPEKRLDVPSDAKPAPQALNPVRRPTRRRGDAAPLPRCRSRSERSEAARVRTVLRPLDSDLDPDGAGKPSERAARQ